MAISETLTEALIDDIRTINNFWLAEQETRFLFVEDGLYDQLEPRFSVIAEPDVERATVNDITDIVVNAYSRSDEWEKRLAPALKQRCTWSCRHATQSFLGGVNRGMPGDWKIGGWARAQKDQRAIDAVGEMRQSYNSRLRGWVEEVKEQWIKEQGSLRGLNRKSMAARLRVKIQNWTDSHDRIAGVTEINTQYDLHLRELVSQNEVEPMVLIEPDDYDDKCRWGCPDYAGNQYPFSETPDFPLHPNCQHYRSVVPGSFSMEDGATVELGGQYRYFLHDLPEVLD